MVGTMRLVNTFIPLHNDLFWGVVVTHTIYSLTDFQVYCAVLLITVTRLTIGSSELLGLGICGL